MNWWSYAITEIVYQKQSKMTCPHCGHKAEVELKDENY